MPSDQHTLTQGTSLGTADVSRDLPAVDNPPTRSEERLLRRELAALRRRIKDLHSAREYELTFDLARELYPRIEEIESDLVRCAKRDEPNPAEYLYGNWQVENERGQIVWEVKQFKIVKKTAKRIFYDYGYAPRTRTVDRLTLEQTGSVYNRSVGAWAPDYQLFANRADAEPAPTETRAERISRLRAEMAAVHPDRGGDAADFRAAYARYQQAVRRG